MNIAVQLAGASFELCSIKESADFMFTIPGVQEIICSFEESSFVFINCKLRFIIACDDKNVLHLF